MELESLFVAFFHPCRVAGLKQTFQLFLFMGWLWNYMIDFNLGVATQATYEIKRIDSDYFDEESV